jgi:hypothetical protein
MKARYKYSYRAGAWFRVWPPMCEQALIALLGAPPVLRCPTESI